MEKDSPSKPSVAELAGRLKGHFLPMPSPNDELPFRRKPPCSLKLQKRQDDTEESDQTIVSPKPTRIKMKNSSIIEKLQANLALSPSTLLPSPKSPEVKLQPLSPVTPSGGPLSPTLRASRPSSTEDEDPVSFESPPEGTPLPCFNKTRARLSFKRRPPTRQHRRSAGEEAGAFGSGLSPCELCTPRENGDGDQVFASPDEEGEDKQLREAEEEEEDDERDCEKAEREPGNPAEEGGDAEVADGEQSGEALKDTEGGCPMQEEDGQVEEEDDEDEEEEEDQEQNSM